MTSNFYITATCLNSVLLFNKVAVASCDHQKSKLREVAVANDFWVAELRMRQVKIGRKSCFAVNTLRVVGRSENPVVAVVI